MPFYSKIESMLWFSLLGLMSFTSQEFVGAGVQLFRFTSGKPEVLFVQNRLTKKWSFPKGHREPFDNSYYDTAIREVFEETGYRLHEDYEICDNGWNVWGERPYWTGFMLTNRTPTLLETEHGAVTWFDVDKKTLGLSFIKDVKEWKKEGMPIVCY